MPGDRYSLLILLVLSVACALAFQGSRGLYDDTEGRYVEVAREMLETGSYLEPTLHHQPHWTKPPLTYWAIAAGIRVFGRNTWGARSYNVIAFVITVLTVAACGKALWNRKTGFVAGLVYLSSFLPVIGECVVTTDTLLVMWEVLAVFCYIRAYRDPGRNGSRMWVRAMWIAFGVAFFTKGPPALVPCVALVVFHFHARRPFVLFDLTGMFAFLVTALWWFTLVVIRYPDLLGYFIGKEVVARSVSTEFRRNPQWYALFYIYFPVLLVGQGLWLYYGLRLAIHKELYKPATYRGLLHTGGTSASLLFLWYLIPLVIFCLSRSRLQLYILPLFAPMALATARHILRVHGSVTGVRRALWLSFVSVVLIVLLKGFLPHVPNRQDTGRLYQSAKSAAGGNAIYTLFQEPGLLGFDFYTDGNVRRVSLHPGDPWADLDLQSLMGEIHTTQSSLPYVIVSSDESANQLTHALSQAGLRYDQTAEYRRKIFVVRSG